jgi:hypothetical protein
MGLSVETQKRPKRDWKAELTPRDRRILALASSKLGARRSDFDAVVRALREAVEEIIPAGRIYLLAPGPVVGSQITGIGVAPGPVVVRVTDRIEVLGAL